MDLKVFTTIFIIGICFTLGVLTSDCYNCRQNTCTHAYCNLVEQTIQGSGLNGLSLEEWNNIPNCPKQSSDLNENSTYMMTCQTGQVCGKLDLHFTTASVMSITPGSNNSIGSIPILASGRESYESTTSIFGCLSPEFKCPVEELSRKFQVPSVENPEKSTTVTVSSDSLNCCNCDGNLCNTFDGKMNCNQVEHQPGIDGTNSGVVNKISVFQVCLALTTAILYKVW